VKRDEEEGGRGIDEVQSFSSFHLPPKSHPTRSAPTHPTKGKKHAKRNSENKTTMKRIIKHIKKRPYATTQHAPPERRKEEKKI